MPGPIVLPAEFGPGVPLSARQLNDLQQEILRQLYAHTHQGDENGPPLETDAYSDRSVTNPKLADGAVDARNIAADAIGSNHLAENSVTARALADNSVDTQALVDGAVTEAKLSAAVQLLLRRTGDSASSASQVIWRDPQVVWEPRPDLPSIIDTFIDPGKVYWKPPVIGVGGPFSDPIQIDPRLIEKDGVLVLDPYRTYGSDRPLHASDPTLAVKLGEAVAGTTQEIETVGAFEVTGGNFGEFGIGSGVSPGIVSMTGGSPTGVITHGVPGAGLAGLHDGIGGGFGAGFNAGGGFARGFSPNMGGSPGFAPAPASPFSQPTPSPIPENLPPEPNAGPANVVHATKEMDSQHKAHERAAAALHAAQSKTHSVQVALTKEGRQAAGRMTTIGSVDIHGKPVPVGTEGSFTVSSGFAGKSSFFDGDDTLDFRAIGNAGDRKRAAQAGQLMLYNLGIDRSYVNSLDGKVTTENIRLMMQAVEANPDFYKPTNPIWGNNSWLPDVLNRPDLFGSGYAISGGRNILDVTRQSTAFIGERTEYVRVRFITPYLNSAYSVTVTPRTRSGYKMITGHIRNKSPKHCDIHFTGLRSDGTVEDINDLSFDLAVFGKLANG